MQIPIDTTVINNDIDEKYEERKKLLKQTIHVLSNSIIELKCSPESNALEQASIVRYIDKLQSELKELEEESKKKK